MDFSKSNPQRILIINIFGIGDVLFTTPLISNLKKSYPDADIDYLCNKRTAVILDNNPQIRKVFVYERDYYKKLSDQSYWVYLNAIYKLISDIRYEKYDLLFDFSLNASIGFIGFLSGIPHRIGFNYKNRGKFLNHKIKLDQNGYHEKHMVEYYLDLLNEFGFDSSEKYMKMYPSSDDLAYAAAFFEENHLNQVQKVIGLSPGGGASWGKDAHLKRWGSEKYAKLADNLIENQSARIILFGDKSEEDLCREIVKLMRYKPVLACGKTDLHQFSALTQKCDLVVLNDGGPLHMAVASGAKTVSIFGPVDDKVYGPYPRNGHLVVRKNREEAPQYKGFRLKEGSGKSQLELTTVEDVYNAVLSVL